MINNIFLKTNLKIYKGIMNRNIAASDLADLYEFGGDAKLNHDIKVMKIIHNMEEDWLDYENSIYHEDCFYTHYDWDAMYDEDRRCTDKNYISNLKNDLGKLCQCPNHINIFNDKKIKTSHLKY